MKMVWHSIIKIGTFSSKLLLCTVYNLRVIKDLVLKELVSRTTLRCVGGCTSVSDNLLSTLRIANFGPSL